MKKSLMVLAVLWMGAVGLHAEDGVTGTEVVLGQSAAFSGPAAGLGIELWRGAQAYFQGLNAAGGVNGRKIKVLAVDDGYEGDRTLPNTLKFATQDKVFGLFGYVGTPTLVKALPAILRFKDQGFFLFGAFTGAQPQREAPYDEVVFNIRASYRQETAAIVERFTKSLGAKRVGIFIQDDAYGRSGADGVGRALKAKGLEVVAETNYQRNVPYETSMKPQVDSLLAAKADAVIAVGAYTQCAAFIRDARAAGFKGPIADVSFVGADPLLRLLTEEGKKSGSDLTLKLVNSQVVPSYADASLPIVAEYQAAMKKADLTLPAGLGDGKYVPVPLSFGSLEGYVNAKAFAAALKSAPKALTRKAFKSAAEKLSVDLGGLKLKFSPTDHQACEQVFFTVVRGGKWAPLSDWKTLK